MPSQQASRTETAMPTELVLALREQTARSAKLIAASRYNAQHFKIGRASMEPTPPTQEACEWCGGLDLHADDCERPPEVKPTGQAIEIDKVTVRTLQDAERLVAAIQQAARRSFGINPQALGLPSMDIWEFTKLVEKAHCLRNPMRVCVSMPGTIECYAGNELIGFMEVRDGGKVVEV